MIHNLLYLLSRIARTIPRVPGMRRLLFGAECVGNGMHCNPFVGSETFNEMGPLCDTMHHESTCPVRYETMPTLSVVLKVVQAIQ